MHFLYSFQQCLIEKRKMLTFVYLKVPMKRNFIILFGRALQMMKNGIYFIVIVLLVAELFKILIYAN